MHTCLTGDDLQLRPKAEQHKLTVESGNGYDLTLSLFERLRGQGFPVQMLISQHRMQPAISELIRSTVYPDLQVIRCFKQALHTTCAGTSILCFNLTAN